MIDLPKIVEPQTPYVATIKALWNHLPSLAQQIDRVDELDFIPTQPSRSGIPTCKITGATGEPVYLHSRYDPLREAEKWADGVEELARKHNVKTLLLSGELAGDLSQLDNLFDYAFSISSGHGSLEECIANAKQDLKFTAQNIARLLK